MAKEFKIYTRQGDKGQTSLIGGTRVPKYHDRIEAYGTVDELISYTGLLRDQEIKDHFKNVLLTIQDKLMICASILAADCENCEIKIPEIKIEDIQFLESEIDEMEKTLPKLTSFILPGGHTIVSLCHVVRNICRRAERKTILAAEKYAFCEHVIIYLNRLSDYYFVLSRRLSNDLNCEEIKWTPNL